MAFVAKTRLDKFFEASILIKAFDGLLEIIGGILILFVRPEYLNQLVTTFTQHELDEDPHDLVANFLQHAVAGITHGSLVFGSVYLLAHGLVKIVLVVSILRGHFWAYKGLIIFTLGFMAYQSYRFVYTHSPLMVVLTLYDGMVVYLTVMEYRRKAPKSLVRGQD